jgi:outer membrane protein OmpA-like peptidoglycan-associated protein
MYEDDYEDEDGGGGGSTGRKVAVAAGVLALAAGGWFVATNLGGDDGGGGRAVAPATQATRAAAGSVTTTIPETSSTGASGAAPTTAGSTVPGTGVATTSPATTAAPAASTTVAPGPGYETLPDGTPVPVVALFGPTSVTLSGAVPTQAAKDRLQTLAIANAKPGQDTVENLVTINPAVPPTVGVRVVELTSVRFPEGSADILPPHALELDRVAGILNALPWVSVLVIGHGDQGTDPGVSYTLSKNRANSVVGYFVGRGIAPTRLSARAVGDADLLSLNNDAAALELNRRTEFVFNGLLVEG